MKPPFIKKSENKMESKRIGLSYRNMVIRISIELNIKL
jgi:hypothetical protein